MKEIIINFESRQEEIFASQISDETGSYFMVDFTHGSELRNLLHPPLIIKLEGKGFLIPEIPVTESNMESLHNIMFALEYDFNNGLELRQW